jgi:phenylacetate-coenzyme A ligase PaaK-like adenylate-forming protein
MPIAARFEQVFHDSFATDERRTLAVVCFALGTWVGGMFTTSCCRALAAKGYPITLATPGNNREEIWRVVKALAPQFDQTVLLGYPPFLKDVIDGGIAAGIDWKPYKVKLVMAGEVFSEEWRSLVAERLGSTDICYDSASLYGTADAGVLGNETPLSICIRTASERQAGAGAAAVRRIAAADAGAVRSPRPLFREHSRRQCRPAHAAVHRRQWRAADPLSHRRSRRHRRL